MVKNWSKEKQVCCLCGKEFVGFGNNPYPLVEEDDWGPQCCDECTATKVIPAQQEFYATGELPKIVGKPR